MLLVEVSEEDTDVVVSPLVVDTVDVEVMEEDSNKDTEVTTEPHITQEDTTETSLQSHLPSLPCKFSSETFLGRLPMKIWLNSSRLLELSMKLRFFMKVVDLRESVSFNSPALKMLKPLSPSSASEYLAREGLQNSAFFSQLKNNFDSDSLALSSLPSSPSIAMSTEAVL